jgi:UDP:flavonoid glycosyltransferase YjiC (YdhE family)
VDQPYWGRRVFELGCGPKPVRLRKLTSEILAGALTDLTTNMDYRRNAGQIAEQLHDEFGTDRAINIIERVMANYVPRIPGAKKVRKIKPALKLVG